jgi:hypothetical protein
MKEAVRDPEALIVHVGEGAPAKRFDPGGAVIAHGPASAEVKVPVTLTGPVPVLPEDGEIVRVTGTPFVKLVKAVSAAVTPSTVIVYKPLETAALTVKVPMTVPLLAVGLTVQVVRVGAAKAGSKFAGVEEMLWHIAVLAPAKPDPDTVTSVPAGPETGETAIRGTTPRAEVAVSPPGVPIPVTVSV